MTHWLNKFNLSQTTPERFWLPLIVAVAILLRIGAALYLGNSVEIMPGTYDQLSYDMLARQVLAGHGFTVREMWWPLTPAGQPTAHWSYLYTLYLVAVYGLLGYYPLLARLIQAVLVGWLMPWLTYRLGRRFINSTVGLVAAGLMAVYAYFVYYAASLLTEMFYITAILWVFDLAGQLGQVGEQDEAARPVNLKIAWLWLGLALGITVLLRQLFLLFIPFIAAWLLWRGYRAKQVRSMLTTLVTAGLVLAALVLPWTWRNYRAFGSFVLLNTNAGYVFFWGNHPIHGYDFIPILPTETYQSLIPESLRQLNEADLDRALLKEGLGFVQADPVRYVVLSLSRFKEYFKFWPSADSGLVSNMSRVISFGILWPFMLYGLIMSWRRTRLSDTSLFYVFMVVYTGIHVLTWTLIRYRLPVDATLLLFAGLALTDLWTRLIRRPTAGQR